MKKKWIAGLCLLLSSIGAFAAPPGSQADGAVDGAMRRQTVETLVAKLNDHYVFPDKAKQTGATLSQRLREGRYDGITDGAQLAKRLTDDLADLLHDKHVSVEFSPGQVPPDRVMGPPPKSLAEWRRLAPPQVVEGVLASSLGLEKVDRLKPNIGYLELSGFPPPFLVAEKYAAAMDKLADTDGLVIDLRNHHGGGPETVALLVSYFVDKRTHLNDIWDRDTGATTQFWTVDKLGGKRYGGRKPVVILTGPGTMSAGEDFAYTMQALKRATLVGERTWGGAHPARPFRLNDHLFAVIPGARSISPITHANWEGVGVLPDVASAPDKALAVATDVLQRKLQASK